jgi:5'-nucleotidase
LLKKYKMRRIYVDMDQVISDYDKLYQTEVSVDNPYPQSRPGFFNDLEPISGAIDAVKQLMVDNDVYILTAPSYMNPHCYIDKRLWIERYFGVDFCKKLIISYNKSLLIGNILIDDGLGNGQSDFDGELIQFGGSEFINWDVVLSYLGAKKKSVHQKMIELLHSDSFDEKISDFIDKQAKQHAFSERWKEKIGKFIDTCTQADIDNYIKWENKLQQYYYLERNTETTSHIFNIILKFAEDLGEDVYDTEVQLPHSDFLSSAYKIIGYTMLTYDGQGTITRVINKNREIVI